MGNQESSFNEPTRKGIRGSRPLDQRWVVEIGRPGGFNGSGQLWVALHSLTTVRPPEMRRVRVPGGLGVA
jgi:hypothetical protein